MSRKGPLYANLPSSSKSTSKLITKGDIFCLNQPELLRGEVINSVIKKLERGFDNTNKGKNGEDSKTTLVKF
eukprot:2361213-Ditylum_brightwellii.AAC.1